MYPKENRRLRIGTLISSFIYGGAELQLLHFLERIDRQKFEPIAFTMNDPGPLGSRLTEMAVEVVVLQLRKKKLFSSLKQSFKALRNQNLDILYCPLATSIIIGSVLGKLAGVKRIVGGIRGLGRTWSRGQIWQVRLADLLVHSYIVNSNAIKESHVKQERINPRKVEVIPNGLDLTVFPYSAEKQDLIGIVGSLKEIKGQSQFLRAARILLNHGYNFVFMIIGDGPDRTSLEVLARELGIADHVQFTGNVNNVGDLVGKLKVLVSASAFEGMSNAIIEAFSCGTPVVASNVTSNNEVVKHGQTGMLYTHGDETDLAAQIMALLLDTELYRSIQSNARRTAEECFGMSRMIQQMEDHFQRVSDCV